MAETYTSKYASGAVVDAALDKAGTALQAGDVVNALNSTETAKPLSAAQGKALADGKITGPASATDNAIARFDGTTGKLVQDSANATMADNGALTLATGAVTDPQPILDLSQTWNDANDTFTAIKANVADTASASGSLLMDLQAGGASKFKVAKTGTISFSGHRFYSDASAICLTDASNITSIIARNDFTLIPTSASFGWGNLASFNYDLALYRDAANTLAQRNYTNAQTFRVYNTYTDASNYERGKIAWESNVLKIGTEKGGTGTAQALELQTGGTTRLTLNTAGTATFSGSITVSGGIVRTDYINSSNDQISWLHGSDYVNGRMTFANARTNPMFRFGGTTSSFPALKRNGTGIDVRLADDSDYAPIKGKLTTVANAVAETITPDHTITLYDAAGTAYKVPCVAA